MCGLAGIFDYGASRADGPDERVGLAMLEAILHRGPDDGCLIVGERMLLGHRRLAILDLSPLGAQPMSDAGGRCLLAYVGEVCNYRELREELRKAGHAFRSTSDTEVVLHAYLEWGHDSVRRLNGMFAFALWDRQEDSLWLVRDGLGIKSLFYRDDGSRLHFGSEIKAILADERVPRQIDLPAIGRYMASAAALIPSAIAVGAARYGERLALWRFPGGPDCLQSGSNEVRQQDSGRRSDPKSDRR